MATTIVNTLSLAEVAFLLRARLGPLRNWTNFLTDNIRGRQNVEGHTLRPCGRQHDGTAYRPIYAVPDVMNFINKVLAAVSHAGRAPIKTTTLAIDRGRHWRVNKFDQNGKLVATPRRITPLCFQTI